MDNVDRKSLLTLTLIVACCSSYASAETPEVKYPSGYRHWTHINSMILPEGHFEGIHHIYANESALKALRNQTPYPDGAVFVFDLFEVVIKDNVTTAGQRKFVNVMQKDQKLFPATGGWGYEEFKPLTQERMVKDPMESCHGCHTSQESKGYVFSTFRE